MVKNVRILEWSRVYKFWNGPECEKIKKYKMSGLGHKMQSSWTVQYVKVLDQFKFFFF